MNRTSLTMVIPLVLLAALAMTPVMIAEDAFARYQRHTGGDLSQAASITNSCLNPISNSNANDNMISNGNCGGTVSQQGRSGQASTPTTVQNANPNIEVQRSTTTAQSPVTGTHTTCTQCFDMLNATQKQAANQTLAGEFDFASGVWPPGITNLVELCNAWNKLTEEQRGEAITDISSLLNQIHVDSATSQKITTCLLEVIPVG
jgi:hypothetical protein